MLAKLKVILLCVLSGILTGCANVSKPLKMQIHDRNEIVWGVDVESGVFGHYDIEHNEIVGFDADIARAVTKEILGPSGKATFVEVFGKTRVPMLKSKNIDVVAATLTITDERAKVVDFSDSYFTAGQALLVKKGSPITKLDDMNEEHTLIMVKGTTSDASVKENNQKVKTIAFESYAEAFVALQSGQGDAMTSDNSILFAFAVEDDNYTVLPTLFSTEYYGLAIDQGQSEFLDEINEALKKLKENGVYDEIYRKWIPESKGE